MFDDFTKFCIYSLRAGRAIVANTGIPGCLNATEDGKSRTPKMAIVKSSKSLGL